MKDKVLVSGFEELVASLRKKIEFMGELAGEVDAGKRVLREEAERVGLASGASTFEFASKGGMSGLKVSLCDGTKPGNRVNVSNEFLAEHPLAVEREVSFVLRGEWVTWLDALLAGFTGPKPDGLERKEVVRATAEQVGTLRSLAAGGDLDALKILREIVRAPSVGVVK